MGGNEIPLPPAPEPALMSEPVPAEPEAPAEPPVPAGDRLPAAPTVPVSPSPSSSGSNAGLKWFVIIIVGLLLVCGVSFAWYLLSYPDTQGVSVIRMEGTMVTGEAYDAETIGSEVIGGELRNAADDPMIEAIVLRVNSPGGTPAAAQEIIRDLDYAKSKKPVVVSMVLQDN